MKNKDELRSMAEGFQHYVDEVLDKTRDKSEQALAEADFYAGASVLMRLIANGVDDKKLCDEIFVMARRKINEGLRGVH